MITVQVKTTIRDFFEKWLEWMNPMIPLKEMDRKILSAYLVLYYTNLSRFENKILLNELVFNESTKEVLIKRLQVSRPQINKALKHLITLGIIKEDEEKLSFNPLFVSKDLESLKKINIVFSIAPTDK